MFIDGGSGPTPVTAEQANASLAVARRRGSPWLTFGGIPAPFTGLFNTTGALGAIRSPNAPSLGQAWPAAAGEPEAARAGHQPGQYGYALDTETSPPGLIAAQAHLGHLAASGDPRGWDQAGEITPIGRYARHVLRAGA